MAYTFQNNYQKCVQVKIQNIIVNYARDIYPSFLQNGDYNVITLLIISTFKNFVETEDV